LQLSKKGEISRENVALTLIDLLLPDLASEATFKILDGDQPIDEAIT